MEDFKKLFQYAQLENFKDYSTFLKTLTDVLATIALFVTVVLAVALVCWAVAIRNRDEQYLVGARKTMLGIVLGYSLGVIATIGSLRILRNAMKGEFSGNFWYVLGLFVLLIVAVFVTLALQKKGYPWGKWVTLIFAVVIGCYVFVLIFVTEVQPDYIPLSNWQMYLFSVLLVATIVFLSLWGSKSSQYDTSALTYAAICIALSFALSYIKFFSMPQGGSVTFASLFPLALYSYMFGTRRGVIAGVVYGLLQFVQSPQFYQPMQVLLDYPIAFGAIGVAGVGRKMTFLKGDIRLEFVFGTTIAVVLRYIAHIVSGCYVFYTWAGEQNPFVYSLVYNSYTMVDLAIVLVVGVFALSSKTLRRTVLSVSVDNRDIAAERAQGC